MRKLLLAAAAVVATSPGVAGAAEISVVNPSLPKQPPPVLMPATPALSPAFTQQPFPLAATVPAPSAPALPVAASSQHPTAVGARPTTHP